MGWTQPFPPDAKRRHFETLYKLYKIDHFGAVKTKNWTRASGALPLPQIPLAFDSPSSQTRLPNSPSVTRLLLI